MLLSRDKKNNVYPCKPLFYFLKVGFKGVKIIQVSFHDVILNGMEGKPCFNKSKTKRKILFALFI